jgi:preprotein translocase subunit SecE
MIEYVKEVKRELKKVSWPSKQEVIRMTLTVIIVSAAVAGLITGLDFVFQKLISFLITIT